MYGLTIFYIEPKCKILKSPILLMHGHMLTSDCWVLGNETSLAFDLVENCHPVYLGNSRGNYYSQRHRKLSKNSSEFWNFSYEEIGLYDVAAMLIHIYHKHKGMQVHYVGHSQGCAEILILLAERAQFQLIVGTVFLLAPATYFRHSRTLLFIIPRNIYGCQVDANEAYYNYFQSNFLIKFIGQHFCSNYARTCNIIQQLIFGQSNDNSNGVIYYKAI